MTAMRLIAEPHRRQMSGLPLSASRPAAALGIYLVDLRNQSGPGWLRPFLAKRLPLEGVTGGVGHRRGLRGFRLRGHRLRVGLLPPVGGFRRARAAAAPGMNVVGFRHPWLRRPRAIHGSGVRWAMESGALHRLQDIGAPRAYAGRDETEGIAAACTDYHDGGNTHGDWKTTAAGVCDRAEWLPAGGFKSEVRRSPLTPLKTDARLFPSLSRSCGNRSNSPSTGGSAE